MMHKQDAIQEPQKIPFKCSQCMLIFKSKVFLFEHLTNVHGFATDVALREACVKTAESPRVKTGSRLHSRDEKPDSSTGGPVATQHKHEAAETKVTSTSKTKGALGKSNNVKMHKKQAQAQTITKYFSASSGSNGKTPVKSGDTAELLDSTTGPLVLEESLSSSSPNCGGVLKITAKSTIDIPKNVSKQSLLHDSLRTANQRKKPEREHDEPIPKRPDKRVFDENIEGEPPKKVKKNEKETKLPSNSSESDFEWIEHDDKTMSCVKEESSGLYFCKHCDYSHTDVQQVSTHYQYDHPYVRFKMEYIRDPKDRSATYRCLYCPSEFLTVVALKKHHKDTHVDVPDVFTLQLRDHRLVFRCFLCSLTANKLRTLREHYKEKHPKHRVDNTLMNLRYLVSQCQEGLCPFSTYEKTHLKGPGELYPDSGPVPCEKEKSAPSLQQSASKEADVAVYQCSHCEFSNKSVVVMHVHYQKTHPDEEVTIHKMKQLARVQSPGKSLQSPNLVTKTDKSTHQEGPPDSSKKTKNKEKSSQQNISSSLANSELSPLSESFDSEEEEPVKDCSDTVSLNKAKTMFYCQVCSYSNAKIKMVISHHNTKHMLVARTNIEEVSKYKADVESGKSQRCTKTKPDNALLTSTPKAHPYARVEDLFYCHKCNYANPSIQGIMNHQFQLHANVQSSRENIINYTNFVRGQIEESKCEASGSSVSTDLPLPVMIKGDEKKFFCHHCNYRQMSVIHLMGHYSKKHRGFAATAAEIRSHTSWILEQTQKLNLETPASQKFNQDSMKKKRNGKNKTKKSAKSTSDSTSPSESASQTKTLRCHRCTFTTQHVHLLRRHIHRVHRSHHSTLDLLKIYMKQGSLQSDYHCDLCVFSHKKAAVMYKHYQKQHPGSESGLDFINKCLYVGSETFSQQKKNSRAKSSGDGENDGSGTDGLEPAQTPKQNETNKYSCRACSFKGSSVESVTDHYRAVHPWSVKEDGSVPPVLSISRKKTSTKRQVEDSTESFESFEDYQMPLEFEKSAGSSDEAKKSLSIFKCSYCSESFRTHHGLVSHTGMKHRGFPEQTTEPTKEESVQKHTTIFKCPHCTYINTNHKGLITHCLMLHPALPSMDGYEGFPISEEHLQNLSNSLRKTSSGLSSYRGYMCEICSQVFANQRRLDKHCEKEHHQTKGDKAASKLQNTLVQNNQRSLSKASLYKKYTNMTCQYCTYHCTTKLAMSRHLRLTHNMLSVSESLDCLHRCAVCSKFYFKKKRLGHHYIKKHGKNAYLKYFVPLYERKSTTKTPESALAQQAENASEVCSSSTDLDKVKKLFFRCPDCPYVNTTYHGVLTHCQMNHPEYKVRADELQTAEIHLSNMVNCTTGKAANQRGFECTSCPQIHGSLKKLRVHFEQDHGKASQKPKEKPNPPSECPSDKPPVQSEQVLHKCHHCAYVGLHRGNLSKHYKFSHLLDDVTIMKLLHEGDKHTEEKVSEQPESEETAQRKCKMCPSLCFDSSQLLSAHYSSIHSSQCKSDFTVIYPRSKHRTGVYRCGHCAKLVNGIKLLCYHLDLHRRALLPTPPEAKSAVHPQPANKSEPIVEPVSGQPTETSRAPTNWPLLPSKPANEEQPEVETRKDKHTCSQCLRTFMSVKGLRCHERSHAALAAIKLKNLPQSVSENYSINQFVIYRAGNVKPYLCSICSYKTTVMGLWTSHFMNKHRGFISGLSEADNPEDMDAKKDDKGLYNSFEEINNSSETDRESDIAEESQYLEPRDVQRQLNHYSWMAQKGASSKANVHEIRFPEDSVLYCELCNFSTEHLSSIRRHYINRHGKKPLRCKDCQFITCMKKNLEMHTQTYHSATKSKPLDHKDFRCPFCLYLTKNKNSMIDHIILHRDQRVMPMEVRRSKLSRYLQGIVFRCHKCTYTSASAENLHLHMTKHDDVKPYKCRLCYYDSTQLCDLEEHLCSKHQVVRNHELVGQISLDQLEDRMGRGPEGEETSLSNTEGHSRGREDDKTAEFATDSTEYSQGSQTDYRSITRPAEDNHENQWSDDGEASNGSLARGSGFDPRCANVKVKEESVEKCFESPEMADKLQMKEFEDKTVKIKARVEDNIFRNILQLDQDSSISQIRRKAVWDRTVKMKPDAACKVGNVHQDLFQDENSTLAHNSVSRPESKTKGIQAATTKIPKLENLRPQGGLTSEIRLLSPKRKEKHGNHVSPKNCQQQSFSQKPCGELTDCYGEMPVLSNEGSERQEPSLGHCKEEEQSDDLESKRDQQDKVPTENNGEPCRDHSDQKKKDADVPIVIKDEDVAEDMAVDGVGEIVRSSVPEDTSFTCEFCGRNLLSDSELERHVKRHGM